MTTTTANTIQTTTSTPQRWTVVAVPAVPAVAQPARRERRARDFGVGYGNSSGYASSKRYADNWGNARFHCG